MLKRTTILMAVLFVLQGTLIPLTVMAQSPAPAAELEKGLTEIEKELTDLEREIDVLLEDLVDPKTTSLSVFFSARTIRGQVPVSIQILLDGELLASRELSETDRLVLIRGGAMEIYEGIVEPASHNLGVECFLSEPGSQGGVVGTGKRSFDLEIGRAVANFVEINLAENASGQASPYQLTARYWSKEP